MSGYYWTGLKWWQRFLTFWLYGLVFAGMCIAGTPIEVRELTPEEYHSQFALESKEVN